MYYRVELYLYDIESSNEVLYMRDIIVKKCLTYAREVYTNKKFFIIPVGHPEDLYISDNQLIVYESDFNSNNEVSSCEISKYVDAFDSDSFFEILKKDYRYKNRKIKEKAKGGI